MVDKAEQISVEKLLESGDALYVIAMKPSDDGGYCVISLDDQNASRKANLRGIIRSVSLLGSGALPWFRDEAGLHIHADVRGEMPVVFKLTIKSSRFYPPSTA